METNEITKITVEATVHAPIEKVWQMWTNPEHITKWNNASDDWHTPHAENDLRTGGKFTSRMEAKDGSMGFDFSGTYDIVEENKLIEYSLEDGRKVRITFSEFENQIKITQTFDADQSHPIEMQKQGWQKIMDNFKKHVEKPAEMEKMHYDIIINADTQKVYEAMIDPDHYRTWTSEFHPTSRYEGSWVKGAKILFIGEDQDGQKGGMVGRIEENIPNKFISIVHLGLVQNDEEITSGPMVEGWAGAHENYTFEDANGQTKLSIDVDCNEYFKEFFNEAWP